MSTTITLHRTPAAEAFVQQTYTVAGFEIRWDTHIQAWEIACRIRTTTPGGAPWSFRIGRVVDGEILITELVQNTVPAGDTLSIEAADALGQLWAQGVDLGEWTRQAVAA